MLNAILMVVSALLIILSLLQGGKSDGISSACLLYTSDAADD